MDKLKILYVDDEIINLKLLEANLDGKYDVLIADGGLLGLDIISKNKDLKVVISDMNMPNMNGLEFIKKAKIIAPHIKYYMLSGFDISSEIQKEIDLGLIQKYFSKPYNVNDLSFEIES